MFVYLHTHHIGCAKPYDVKQDTPRLHNARPTKSSSSRPSHRPKSAEVSRVGSHRPLDLLQLFLHLFETGVDRSETLLHEVPERLEFVVYPPFKGLELSVHPPFKCLHRSTNSPRVSYETHQQRKYKRSSTASAFDRQTKLQFCEEPPIQYHLGNKKATTNRRKVMLTQEEETCDSRSTVAEHQPGVPLTKGQTCSFFDMLRLLSL